MFGKIAIYAESVVIAYPSEYDDTKTDRSKDIIKGISHLDKGHDKIMQTFISNVLASPIINTLL